MRGFSNRAFAQPTHSERAERALEVLQKPHLTEMAIAKRFAPRIVSRQETISGESGLEQPIAMSWDLAKRSFAQGFRCLWNIVRVLLARARLRLRIAYTRVMQARALPWALAGSGGGMSMGLAVLIVVVR